MFQQGGSRKGPGRPGVKTGPRTKTGFRPTGLNLDVGGVKESFQNSVVADRFQCEVARQNGEAKFSQAMPMEEDFNDVIANGLSPAVSNRFAASCASMDSGSGGSPSRSEVALLTPGSNGTMSNDPDSVDMVGRKKKRGNRSTVGEKGGKGLRHFSMKVCEKVESKVRTTYNEVADELVAEFTDPNTLFVSPDQQQYDEKNIRRRVYDALNVLMAMDIIAKEKKEIQWKGLPSTGVNDIEQLKDERLRVQSRIDKKKKYLDELQEQIQGIQNLVQRNETAYNSTGSLPSVGVDLPFIIVQTRPQATVEVEISEDMQLVHFDFNSSPFELHDDAAVLKAMRLSQSNNWDNHPGSNMSIGAMASPSSNLYQWSIHPHCAGTTASIPHVFARGLKPAGSPPLPGILKARVKHENT